MNWKKEPLVWVIAFWIILTYAPMLLTLIPGIHKSASVLMIFMYVAKVGLFIYGAYLVIKLLKKNNESSAQIIQANQHALGLDIPANHVHKPDDGSKKFYTKVLLLLVLIGAGLPITGTILLLLVCIVGSAF